MRKEVRKPFLCRIGLHSQYMDCALIYSVLKCNNCGWVKSRYDADKLDKERKVVAEYGIILESLDLPEAWIFITRKVDEMSVRRKSR